MVVRKRLAQGSQLAYVLVRQPRQLRHLPKVLAGYRRSTVDLRRPWMSYDFVAWLSEAVGPSDRIFEFGGGGSTAWFADRVQEVVTAEANPHWAADVRKAVKNLNATIHVPADASEQAFAEIIDQYPDDYFDAVLVDGGNRPLCIAHARPKIRPGGYLFLDDCQRPEYLSVGDMLLGWEYDSVVGLAPGKFERSHTAIWRRPS